MNLFWKPETVQGEQEKDTRITIIILMGACLLTSFASLVLPSVLLTNEVGSPRLAYLPGISLTLFIGFGIALAISYLRQKVVQRIILALVTVSMLILSVHVLGYTRLYQLSHQLDRFQLAALQKAVPQASVEENKITFAPFDVDDDFLGYPIITNPTFILIGAFTAPNSIRTILQNAYPNAKVNVIRPGYGNFTWAIDLTENNTLMLSGYAADPPHEVSPNDVVLFRYRQNITVEVAEAIQFTDEQGAILREVTLPLAVKLRDDYGTRTFILNTLYTP